MSDFFKIMNCAYFIVSFFFLTNVNAGKPGPEIVATKGQLWPKPQQQNVSASYFVLQPRTFEFQIQKGSSDCALLSNAFTRYFKILQQDAEMIKRRLSRMGKDQLKKARLEKDNNFLGYLNKLTVNLTDLCNDNDYPSLNMDEAYKLWVTEDRTELQATSVWGILRGLDSFSQLIYLGEDGLTLRINSTIIKDFPRYKHRGLLIDTSRHFIPMEKIYATLDGMTYNKLNVLHWHIVDDQSFPYVSLRFPELSEKGAFNRYTMTYTPEDVQNVIEYARIRGIRIMPEFDTPGHTASWGLSHPEILTSCDVYFTYGPMDPSKSTTYDFLNELFGEIRDVFKDAFIHLGGDEVDYLCWQADKNITQFMKQKNITTYKGLEGYYVQKVVDMIKTLNYSSIVWEEVFSNGVKLSNETLVHVWKQGWVDTMKSVTASGKHALLSACWYLDNVGSGGDWQDFYLCDPSDFEGTAEQKKLILGGEACMWGEVVNEYNIISRVWPRASATAEKLWSAYSKDYDMEEPSSRLEEHSCRMNRRGVGAQPPNGPGFCD
ncbi:beta-hexosaminidase subunit alpha-like [Anthonomus grandis grandis]|uniref:beta-hexosaminidase subunit alpha-like n=1 Tax=Anthonomus grandis grandis TaxID=2921223 RepID=UPI002165C0CD|nr:beta-hexosaminidase subunit alpha-like [Anthonomus grandis grandis]